MDFYADVSMAIFDDQQFINLVSDSWKIKEADYLKVSKEEIENLVTSFRKCLMRLSKQQHHEEFVLRELFRAFERQNNGIITVEIFRSMLEKVDLTAPDEHIEALLIQADLSGNANGVVEFEEFVHFVILSRYTKK
jgi:Ca2+-binding EF-hand superfamily protein